MEQRRQLKFMAMRWVLMSIWSLTGLLFGQEPVVEATQADANWPALPSWSIEELELIRSGKLEIGTALFIDDPGEVAYSDLFEPLPLASEAPEVIDDGQPKMVKIEFFQSYFGGRPASYLVDPQGLLSAQELSDRQAFLDYHAGDSQIDLYIYLFDENQRVPSDGEITYTFKRNFSRGNGLSALVYYFMGEPERTLLVTSPQVDAVVSETARKSALVYSKLQAESKSEPVSQLENFSAALSIRLYWMEQELLKASGAGLSLGDGGAEPSVVNAEEVVEEAEDKDTKVLLVVGVVSGMLVVLGAGFVWWTLQQRKSYRFPEMEVKPLLGAPHAAGVGAVIHFGNATLPPSVQKEQVPDYLRKM